MSNPEIWKPVPGYEGFYEVSNLGNIRSLPRLSKNAFAKSGQMLVQGKTLSQHLNKWNGYLSVMLCLNGKTRRFYIHRLVASAFLPNSNDYKEVNHKNENKTDNRADNLEWCDRVYNRNYGTGDARRLQAARNNKKGRCYPKRISQFSLSGEYIASYDSSEDAARAIGKPGAGSNIRTCARGDNYNQSHGYIWKYTDTPTLFYE